MKNTMFILCLIMSGVLILCACSGKNGADNENFDNVLTGASETPENIKGTEASRIIEVTDTALVPEGAGSVGISGKTDVTGITSGEENPGRTEEGNPSGIPAGEENPGRTEEGNPSGIPAGEENPSGIPAGEENPEKTEEGNSSEITAGEETTGIQDEADSAESTYTTVPPEMTETPQEAENEGLPETSEGTEEPGITAAPSEIIFPSPALPSPAALSPYPEQLLNDDIQSLISEVEEKYTSIPVICICTEDGEEVTSLKEYKQSSVYLVNCEEQYSFMNEAAGVRVRGNSSAYYGNVDMILKNQVPYRIKFNKKRNMLGLNNGAECKNWVLIRAEWDVVKADLAFRLGRSFCRNGNYCSDGRLVLVYLNNSLKGIYELCEQNQVNKHRVNIKEPTEGYGGTDIGYLLEIDNYCEKPYFVVDYASRGTVTDINGIERAFIPAEYSIKSDVYSDLQKSFIKKYINNVFNILYDACVNSEYRTFDKNYDIVDSDTSRLQELVEQGVYYSEAEAVADEMMDLDSVIDMYLIYELYKDRDVGEGSFFMCVDFSHDSTCRKLRFCSPWDFEWSCEGAAGDGFYAGVFNTEEFAKIYEDRSNPWFILLMSQEWFYRRVQERWQELRKDSVPVEAEMRQLYQEIREMNPKATNEEILNGMTDRYGKFDTNNIVDICLAEEKNAIAEVKSDINRVSAGISDSAYYHVSYITKRVSWMDEMMTDEMRESVYAESESDGKQEMKASIKNKGVK